MRRDPGKDSTKRSPTPSRTIGKKATGSDGTGNQRLIQSKALLNLLRQGNDVQEEGGLPTLFNESPLQVVEPGGAGQNYQGRKELVSSRARGTERRTSIRTTTRKEGQGPRKMKRNSPAHARQKEGEGEAPSKMQRKKRHQLFASIKEGVFLIKTKNDEKPVSRWEGTWK